MNFLKQLIMKLIAFFFWGIFYIIAFWVLVWFLLGIDVLQGFGLLEKTWPVRVQQFSNITSYLTQKKVQVFPKEQMPSPVSAEETTEAPEQVKEEVIVQVKTTVTEPLASPSVPSEPAVEEEGPSVEEQGTEPMPEPVDSVQEQEPVADVESAEPEVIATEAVVIDTPVPLPGETAEISVEIPQEELVVEPIATTPPAESQLAPTEGVLTEPTEPANPVAEPAEPEAAPAPEAKVFPDDVLPLLPEDDNQIAMPKETGTPENQTVINPGTLAEKQE